MARPRPWPRYFSAQKIDLPESKVKCITHYMGGGFGSKFGPDIQGIVCAELARKAKAPVKLMLDRYEEIVAGGNRPSAFGKVKIGGTKDGTVTAYEVESYGSPGVGNSAHGRTAALRLSLRVQAQAHASSGSTRALSGPCGPRAIRRAAT